MAWLAARTGKDPRELTGSSMPYWSRTRLLALAWAFTLPAGIR
jgi:hypothetical protein